MNYLLFLAITLRLALHSVDAQQCSWQQLFPPSTDGPWAISGNSQLPLSVTRTTGVTLYGLAFCVWLPGFVGQPASVTYNNVALRLIHNEVWRDHLGKNHTLGVWVMQNPPIGVSYTFEYTIAVPTPQIVWSLFVLNNAQWPLVWASTGQGITSVKQATSLPQNLNVISGFLVQMALGVGSSSGYSYTSNNPSPPSAANIVGLSSGQYSAINQGQHIAYGAIQTSVTNSAKFDGIMLAVLFPDVTQQVPASVAQPTVCCTQTGRWLLLNWTAPSSDGVILGYQIYWSTAAPFTSFSLLVSDTQQGPGANISSLLPGHSYAFTVAAINPKGPGGQSPSVQVTMPTVPHQISPPPNVSSVTPTSFTVTWQRPNDGGSPIIGWMCVGKYATGGLLFEGVSALQPTGPLAFSYVSAQPQTSYVFVVAAINKVGQANFSVPITVTTPCWLSCCTNPCAHGTCTPLGSTSFNCTCPPGYKGATCAIPRVCGVDYVCQHGGSCASSSQQNPGTGLPLCSCPFGTFGLYCELLLVLPSITFITPPAVPLSGNVSVTIVGEELNFAGQSSGDSRSLGHSFALFVNSVPVQWHALSVNDSRSLALTSGPEYDSLLATVTPNAPNPLYANTFSGLPTRSRRVVWFMAPASSLAGYANVTLVNPVQPQSNLPPASASRNDLLEFSADICGNSNFYYDQNAQSCEPCSSGGICDGVHIYPLPCYWSPSEQTAPSQCHVCDACPGATGGPNATSNIDGSRNTQSCAEGYTSTLCSECDVGYYQDLLYCRSCGLSSSDKQVLITTLFFALAYFLVIAAGIALLNELWLSRLVGTLWAVQQFVVIGRQAASVINSNNLVAFFGAVSFLNFDVNFIKPGCTVAAIPFASVFGYTIAAIAIAAFLLFLGALVRGALHYFGLIVPTDPSDQDSWQKKLKRRMIHAALVLGSLVFLQLWTRFFQGLYCVREFGRLVLFVEPTTECYKGNHLITAIFMWILVFVYGVGFPFYCLRKVTGNLKGRLKLRAVRQRACADLMSRERLEKYGYLYRGLRVEYQWFRMLDFVANFAIAAQTVFAADVGLRIFLASLVFFMKDFLVGSWLPFELSLTNSYYIAAGAVNYGQVLVYLAILGSENADASDWAMFALLAVILVAGTIIIALSHWGPAWLQEPLKRGLRCLACVKRCCPAAHKHMEKRLSSMGDGLPGQLPNGELSVSANGDAPSKRTTPDRIAVEMATAEEHSEPDSQMTSSAKPLNTTID